MMQLRVRIADGETTLTIEEIISINGEKYNPENNPSESDLAARVRILEATLANLIDDFAKVIRDIYQTEETTVANAAGEYHHPTSRAEE